MSEFEKLKGYVRPTDDAMLASSIKFHQALELRRSVRSFSPDAVSLQVIENCIRTAGTAPSGANLQPWHFAVVSDPLIKREIRVAAEEEESAFYSGRATEGWLRDLAPLGTDENKPFLEIAPFLIAVFVRSFRVQPDGSHAKCYYASESVGIAVGMLIAALHLAGLATLTHTPSPMGFLNSILGRPKNERPFLLIVTGFPAEDATVPVIARKSLAEISTFHLPCRPAAIDRE